MHEIDRMMKAGCKEELEWTGELRLSVPVTVGRDEVEQGMNALVFEPRVTFDSRLLGEDIIVLLLEISNDRREGRFVVDVVTEPGRITNGEADGHAILVQLDRLLLDFDVRGTLWSKVDRMSS
jgi:hypothetical protein